MLLLLKKFRSQKVNEIKVNKKIKLHLKKIR